MPSHLTAHLLGEPSAPGARDGRPLRIDHVLLDQESGTLAWLAFAALGRNRIGCDLALTVIEREAAGPDDVADARLLASASHRHGGRLARPGAGPAAAVYERRFAMPGRVLLAAVRGAHGAGAFGTLVLEGPPDALAIAMAGEPWEREPLPVIAVHLEGERPACVRGAEILRALEATFGRRGAGAVLEFTGGGLATLGMSDRLTLARHAPAVLGARAAVFPADEATREWLRARGRESEWRRLDTGGRGFDNEWVLPLSAAGEALEPPAEPATAPAARVRIGPFADDAELRAWADAGQRVRGTGLARAEVWPAGRTQQAALAADGSWARLEAFADVRMAPTAPDPEALRVGGVPGEPGLLAGIDAALAGVLRGRRADPRDGARELALPEGPGALDPAEILESGGESVPPALDVSEAHGDWPRFGRWRGAWAGEVLAAHAGALDAAALLAYGPRLASRRGDARHLATQLFDGSGAFARDAAERDGGALVVHGALREGPELEAAARALVALGVRVVFARSIAPGARGTLARAGILPLRWMRDEDSAHIGAGDELEIAGLPESLDAGVPLALRHRTLGIAVAVEHDLGARELEWVRSGGWLAAVASRGGAPEGETE